ncbi:MAG: hypothetical protein JXR84_06220 [Anaerolineae bacterium]|nr:hypothetical protein [Anaerolineae bacterium]
MAVDKHTRKHMPPILSTIGGVLLIVWGIATAVPVLRGMMLDFAASFLFNFVVTGALWWASRQSESEARSFWRWLAWGWVLNIAGNLAWAAHDFVVGESLAILSWIDGFYIARYGLVFWAFWRYPHRTTCARWAFYVMLLAAATALIWVALFRPVMATVTQPLLYFFGGALYPIMDVVLVYAALMAWTYSAEEKMRTVLLWLVLAMAAYGVANWINFGARSVSLNVSSLVAGLFWLLADVGTGVAALSATGRSAPASMRSRAAPSSTIFVQIPSLAAFLTMGILVIDWVVRSAVDAMLLVCAVIALAASAYRWLLLKKEDEDESGA